MQTMNIALPDSLKEYDQQQIAREGYSSASEYIRELIRTDQKNKAREALELEMLRGLGSGKSEPIAPEDFHAIRKEIQRRHAATHKS